jgi:hypothetical protein
MERGTEFGREFGKDRAAARIGEAGSGAVELWTERWEPNPSNIMPVTSSAISALKALTHAWLFDLLPRLLSNPRPFPITLFLRFTPVV